MLVLVLRYVHVLAAMALFAGLGIEAISLWLLGRAGEAPERRAALAALHRTRFVAGPGFGLTVLVGLVLATLVSAWRAPWVLTSLGGIVVIGAMGGVLSAPRVARLEREPDPGAAAVTEALPMLRLSNRLRLGALAGIVYLMTVKPGLTASLVALTLGILAGLVAGRPAPLQSSPA
jgi:hypothetical protein